MSRSVGHAFVWVAGCVCLLAPRAALAEDVAVCRVEVHKGVFRIRAEVDLPDGAFFYVHVAFAGTAFARSKAVVEGGKLEVALGPFTRALWLGEYRVTARLLPGRQPAPLRHRGERLPAMRVERTVRLGRPEQARAQDAKRREEYRRLLASARASLSEIVDAFAGASRTLGDFGAPEGAEAWECWIVQRHLLAPHPARARRELEGWRRSRAFASEAGSFRATAWRAWLEKMQKRLKRTEAAERRRLAAYVVPRYPAAALDTALLLRSLRELSARYSAVLLRGNDLAPGRRKQWFELELPGDPRGAELDRLRQLFQTVSDDVRLNHKQETRRE